MTLKDLPPKLIEMLLTIRAQILIRKKHDMDSEQVQAVTEKHYRTHKHSEMGKEREKE